MNSGTNRVTVIIERKCGRSAMFLLFRYCLRCASERRAILQIREQMMKKYSDFKFNYYCYSWWWRNFIFHEASDLYNRSTYTHSQTHGRMENLSETCLSIKLILVRVIGVLIQPLQGFTRYLWHRSQSQILSQGFSKLHSLFFIPNFFVPTLRSQSGWWFTWSLWKSLFFLWKVDFEAPD